MTKPIASKRLKPIQRAFMLGFRRAKVDMRREGDDAVDRLETTTAELKAERNALRAEFQRLKAIETGVNYERDPVEHPWLHQRPPKPPTRHEW